MGFLADADEDDDSGEGEEADGGDAEGGEKAAAARVHLGVGDGVCGNFAGLAGEDDFPVGDGDAGDLRHGGADDWIGEIALGDAVGRHLVDEFWGDLFPGDFEGVESEDDLVFQQCWMGDHRAVEVAGV